MPVEFDKQVVDTKGGPKRAFCCQGCPALQKGDTDNAANYRPISLLSSLYKIYMMMIRQRMQDAIDDKLSPTQYGFRLTNPHHMPYMSSVEFKTMLNQRVLV